MADAESRNLLLMLQRKKQIPHCVRNDEPVELNYHGDEGRRAIVTAKAEVL